MKNVAYLAALAGLLAETIHAPDANAKEPVLLKPKSNWVLNYADDSCRLIREFGGPDTSYYLYMEQYQPGDEFNLVVSGPGLRFGSRTGRLTLRFGPDEAEQTPRFLAGNLRDAPALIVRSRISIAPVPDDLFRDDNWQDITTREQPEIGPERQAAVRFLQIGSPLFTHLQFELGPMKPAFAALRTCTDNLLKTWGVDAEKHAKLSRKPVPASNPGKWVLSGDYPRNMLFTGQQALIAFRLIVGEDGKPVSCHIQQSTRPVEFDTAVCKALMKRANFTPALDADGVAIPSYWINSVVFVMQ